MKKLSVLFAAAILTASLFSCGEKRPANQKADVDPQVKVLATVNDVPITAVDVQERLRRSPHGEAISPGATQNVLQTLVRDELIYQKSLELGLDKNPDYRKKLQEAEAQLRTWKRQELSALFLKHMKTKVEVKEAEAQDYFEKNAKRIQTKFHVWQILYRGESTEIAKQYQDLKSGIPFEKVASRRFPNLPKNSKPWDMGYLYWSQIPPAWQGVIDRLEVGQISDIIKGPNDRFWVIKLVDKTVDPKITFATEKEKIVEILSKQKADELYENMLGETKTKAKIVFSQ